MRHRTWTRLPVLLVALMTLLATSASACGGPSREERFAGRVCAAISSFHLTLSDTYDAVRLTRAAPGRETRSTLVLLAEEAVIETGRFGDELKAIPAPNRDDPSAALTTQWLRRVVDGATRTMSRSARRVNALPPSPTLLQSISAFQALEADIYRVIFDVLITRDGVSIVVPELKEAFEESETCQKLERATAG